MTTWRMLLCVLLLSAACAPERGVLRAASEFDCQGDRQVAVLCGGRLCAVVPEGPGGRSARTPTQGVAVVEAPSAELEVPERVGGTAPEGLPGDRSPLITFEINPEPPEAKLPPRIRALLVEEAKKPHVKHHIFPWEFVKFFKEKKINIHDWVIVLLLEDHLRIHRGERGGPWNADWRAWINKNRDEATREDIYRFAGEMLYRYCLVGPIARYYCNGSSQLPKGPPTSPVPAVNEDD